MSSSQVVEKQATNTSTSSPRVQTSFWFVTRSSLIVWRAKGKSAHEAITTTLNYVIDYTQLRDRNQHLSDMITGFKKINNLKLVYKFKKC